MKAAGGHICFEVRGLLLGAEFARGGKNSKNKCRKSKYVVALFALLIVFLAGSVFAGTRVAYALGAGEDELRGELKGSIGTVIDGLDTDDLQGFISSLGEFEREVIDIGDVREALNLLANGQAKDFFSSMLKVLAKAAGIYFAGFVPGFITIIIICLLKNLLGGMTSEFAGGSAEVVHIICYCAVVIILMTGIGTVISTVSDTINLLTKFSSIVFPLLLTVLSMLGGASAIAAYSPLMATLSGVIMRIITAIILPAFVATIVFSVVGNISKNIKLDKLTKVIKSASTWLIGIIYGLFATFLTVQGITGGVVDKFGFNVAKFALSSYVPVLGGYLSDGFDLLSTSLVLVKNALGYSGAIIMICIVIFPLLKVVVFSLATRLTAAIAEPIGDARMSSVLGRVADNMNLLITALAGIGFLFYIIMLLLIGSCNMGL